MTAAKLIKLLSKCHPRAKITIQRDTFRHNLPEVAIFDVDSVEDELIEQCDDDGFLKTNKDGSQHYVRCVVLRGDDWNKETRLTSTDRRMIEEFERRKQEQAAEARA